MTKTGFSLERLLAIWDEEQLLLDDGQDWLSNLDVSIEISIKSPHMQNSPGALEGLSIISLHPDGVTEEMLSKLIGHAMGISESQMTKCEMCLHSLSLLQSSNG